MNPESDLNDIQQTADLLRSLDPLTWPLGMRMRLEENAAGLARLYRYASEWRAQQQAESVPVIPDEPTPEDDYDAMAQDELGRLAAERDGMQEVVDMMEQGGVVVFHNEPITDDLPF